MYRHLKMSDDVWLFVHFVHLRRTVRVRHEVSSPTFQAIAEEDVGQKNNAFTNACQRDTTHFESIPIANNTFEYVSHI